MFKKLLAMALSTTMIMGLGTTSFASEVTSSIVEVTGVQSLEDYASDSISVNSEEYLTGESVELPKTKAGFMLDSTYGSRTGQLTSDDTLDYYLFTVDIPFKSFSQIETSNTNYTMTLGIVQNGQIYLTEYVYSPNQRIIINFEQGGSYAWIIQSNNATYGQSYSLNYHMVADSVNVIHISDDLQQLYSDDFQKLSINGIEQNIDFHHYHRWEVPPVGPGELAWNELGIDMEDANVRAIHVGAVEWYESAQRKYHDNVIVLQLNPGGEFTHLFSQNPPYYNWYNKDAAGIETPRAIDSTDISSRGGHYLIYDIDTGVVIEFASGLTKPWSNLGDKHDLKLL